MYSTKIKTLTYIAISEDGNVITKEADKSLKYKDRITEIKCKWNVTTKVIPVLTL
jgi:hypothetical protein